MVKLITVHGTFAGSPRNRGEKWWQKESPFTSELQSFIGEPVDVEPFHWEGNNSETERRQTGSRLATAIHDCQDPPIVLGHSHGGSAGIQALAMLYLRRGEKCCDLVRGYATVGTPMLLFRSNRNPFSRFDVIGRLLLLFALGLLGLKVGEIAANAYDGQEITGILTGLREFGSSIQFGLAMLILVVLYGYSYRNRRRMKLFKDNTLYGFFKDRYVAMNHAEDEAINGLMKAKAVKPKLVKRTTVFISLFSGLSFVLIGLFFLTQLLEASNLPLPELLRNSFDVLETGLFDPIEDLLYANFPQLGENALLQQLMATFTLIPIGAVLSASALVAFATSVVVTPGLSHFVSNQIKSQSFGDDGYGESIRAVVPGLDFDSDQVGTLPSSVEGQMERASVKDAGAAIQRLRELLASGELLDAKGADLIGQSMKFEKSELLHNAYFHSPLFIRYMAAVFVTRFGVKPSERYANDRAAQEFHELLSTSEVPAAVADEEAAAV